MRARDQEAFRKRFGRRVRAARLAVGFSQRELAERAELADKFLSRIEVGAAVPSVWVAARLARAIGVELDHLIGAKPTSRDARLEALLNRVSLGSPAEVERAIRVLQALIGE